MGERRIQPGELGCGRAVTSLLWKQRGEGRRNGRTSQARGCCHISGGQRSLRRYYRVFSLKKKKPF